MKRKKTRKKISMEAAEDIRKLVANGATLTMVCKVYGISKPYASLIARNMRKRSDHVER